MSRALARAVNRGDLPNPFGWGTAPLALRRRDARPLGRVLRFLVALVVWPNAIWVGSTSVAVACFRFVDPASTVLMGVRKYAEGWEPKPLVGLPLESVPAYVKKMLIAVEDYNFYRHWGIDPEGVERALKLNKAVGKPLYGGSTLTMQVARTIFLVPEKSYLRKYLEVLVALEMELLLGKERILELYFNYAEWGMGTYGFGAAADFYYGKKVDALTKDQAARLVALLSSPLAYNPKTINKRSILKQRYDFLYRTFVE